MILPKKADNKVADETAWMRRLVWAFIVTNHQTGFLSRGRIVICHFTMAHIRKQDAKIDYRAI